MVQLAMLAEVRAPEPPIRLIATFFEPGSPEQVGAELRALGAEAVVAVAAPLSAPLEGRSARTCDGLLRTRGVAPSPPDPLGRRMGAELASLGLFVPSEDAPEGAVPDGAFRQAPVFETNADAVFCALQGRRLPAKRHPHGIRLRIGELLDDHVLDEGGDLWHRRIEEIEAAGAALCAHRYAVGHACWLGDPAESVVVLPGSSIPPEFPAEGVLEPVERVQLPG
jgi:predicted nuclease with RNAse H fold